MDGHIALALFADDHLCAPAKFRRIGLSTKYSATLRPKSTCTSSPGRASIRPNSPWLRRFNLADKGPDRLIGIAEVVLLDQILVRYASTQANLELGANYLRPAFAPTIAPSPNIGNRNGWFSIGFLERAVGDRRDATH